MGEDAGTLLSAVRPIVLHGDLFSLAGDLLIFLPVAVLLFVFERRWERETRADVFLA